MKTTPRYSEFKGFYNVDPEALDDPRDPQDPDQYLFTEPGLGHPGHLEVDAIADLLEELNSQLQHPDRAISYSLGFDDRTAGVTFLDFDLLTTATLERLREMLAAQAPLWRIVVAGPDDDSSIAVYPSAIVYPSEEEPEDSVARIRQSLADQRDRTTGVFERQLQYVQNVLKVEASQLTLPYEPVVLAVFDTESGDDSELCVWLLQDGYAIKNRCWIPETDRGDGFCGTCGTAQYDVRRDGTLTGFMKAGAQFLGRLTALAYHKQDFTGEIILVDPETQTAVRRAIPPSGILTDEQVKETLNYSPTQ
ncbi:MAG: hypothetical protein WD045_07275 [Pirellulaceae bacterium]